MKNKFKSLPKPIRTTLRIAVIALISALVLSIAGPYIVLAIARQPEPEFNFEYQSETVSCLDWFVDRCANYGFVYTGLSGNQQQTLANFRFVGVPHAIASIFTGG